MLRDDGVCFISIDDNVMANESFAEFASTLQKEIENETGVKFGVLEINLFSGMVYEKKNLVKKTITSTQAQEIISTFNETNMIELPPELELAKDRIKEIISKAETEIDLSEIENAVSMGDAILTIPRMKRSIMKKVIS